MPPPPTPASLADLPGPWLLKLAGSDSFEEEDETLWSLSRSCSLFRDLVLRQRKASARFYLPISAEDFPRELRRLCTLARSSRHIRLEVRGPHRNTPWTETEPHVAHLLLCAMAQLGGQPLAAVKEIEFEGMELTSVVPMWLPLVCPNVTNVECYSTTITPHLPLPVLPPPSMTSPANAPLACQHLQRLEAPQTERAGAKHLRQQLAALPSLTSLTVWDTEGLLPQLHSTSLTHLRVDYAPIEASAAGLPHLPVQFPNLVELDASYCLSVDDAGLEALLSVRSLRRVLARRLRLQRSHAQRPCAWEELSLSMPTLDVDHLARLPLEGIQRISIQEDEVQPSRDAQAVARVAAAIKRSGGPGAKGGLTFSGQDPAALLTTLRPLLEALPAEQQRHVTFKGMEQATPEVVQQLGQQLPPAVEGLEFFVCTMVEEAWAAVLPSLPATVARVQLCGSSTPAQAGDHALALCVGAVRPIAVSLRRASKEDVERIRAQLAQLGNTHVTLDMTE